MRTMARSRGQIDWAPDGQRHAYTVPTERPQTGFPCCADILLGAIDGATDKNLTKAMDGFAFEQTWRPIAGS